MIRVQEGELVQITEVWVNYGVVKQGGSVQREDKMEAYKEYKGI